MSSVLQCSPTNPQAFARHTIQLLCRPSYLRVPLDLGDLHMYDSNIHIVILGDKFSMSVVNFLCLFGNNCLFLTTKFQSVRKGGRRQRVSNLFTWSTCFVHRMLGVFHCCKNQSHWSPSCVTVSLIGLSCLVQKFNFRTVMFFLKLF